MRSPDHDLALPRAAAPVFAVRPRLLAATFSHGAVDFFSFLIIPLMSILEGRLSLTHQQGAVVIAVGSACSGLIQPLVAWLSDRHDTRALGTAGFALAVVAVGLVGFVTTYPLLLLLQMVACAGIGAFHPVAAAAVGHLAGEKRSLGVAAFYCAGMVGGFSGNIAAPLWVAHFGAGSTIRGLQSLAWLIAPGMLCVLLLAWAIHSVPHRHEDAHEHHAALEPAERARRWRAVAILYVGNVLRFTVDVAVITLVIRWSEEMALRAAGATALTEELRTQASTLNGPLQAAKQIGMGAGGLVAGWLLRGRSEKTAMMLVPILGAVAIVAMPLAGSLGPAFLITVVAGLGYGGVVPLTISQAQRLLPHRTGLASGLMMGGAWAVGSVGAPLASWLHHSFGLERSFVVVGAMCLATGLLSVLLPRPLQGRAGR
jgi:FSR family fosmidomycin resistance protein-like MFS transporter